MTTLLLHVRGPRAAWWLQTMQQLLPELDCRLADDDFDIDAVEYAAVWRPPAGALAQLPNLRAVFSIGAGVDHVLCDPGYPIKVPLFKTVAPDLTQRMVEYVLLHVLRYHRRLPEITALQTRAEWQQLLTPLAADRTVGVMGLGHIGRAVASALAQQGFNMRAWSRSQHDLAKVQCYAGMPQLPDFLASCEILICLLPLTPDTKGILNRPLFNALPHGAYIINVGRGEHLVEQDLLQALQNEHLAGATLDVFHREPLPQQHLFWAHPKITVTPHIASLIDPISGSKVLAENIRRFRVDDDLAQIRVDLRRGY